MLQSRLGAERYLFTEKRRAVFCHPERVEFLSIVPAPGAVRKRRVGWKKHELLHKCCIARFSVSTATKRNHPTPHVDVKLTRYFSASVGKP